MAGEEEGGGFVVIQIIHADVMDGLRQIPDQTVQCVVTSPPYWGLRDYGTARWEGGDPDCDHIDDAKVSERKRQKKSMISLGERIDGSTRVREHDELIGKGWQYKGECKKCGAHRVDEQIGLESTPEEFVAKMVEVFREVRRVLRDDGTCWLNIGDCYASSPAGNFSEDMPKPGDGGPYRQNKPKCDYSGLKQKDLIGMPWRVAFALQADGWYLRSDIIWSKPNPMPESVTDRPTKSHEYIFLLTKKARYFYDADAVREAGTSIYRSTDFIPKSLKDKNSIGRTSATGASPNNRSDEERTGRNRRTVWEIATQPFPAAHFATFPEALVEPCIKAGTSERGCCSVCGAPWVRVVEKVGEYTTQWGCNHSEARLSLQGVSRRDVSKEKMMISVKNTVDWQPSCTCAADTVPCMVLDPFGGSGTVAKVARDLNRRAILIELNEDYIKIAKERLRLNEQLEVFA